MAKLLKRAGLPALTRASAAAVTAIIDARHPYAAPIAPEAQRAGAAPPPTLRLIRPPWRPTAGDRWIECPSTAVMISRLPSGGRVFVTLGRAEEAPLLADATREYLIRVRDCAPSDPPPHIAYLPGAGPFTAEGERALFERLGVAALATRNDGRRGAAPKIHAARALGLPVFMLSRPGIRGHYTMCPQAAARWAAASLSGGLDRLDEALIFTHSKPKRV
ncbi:MAG: precorrin-6A/cobalt-precorrin-6A reductase [Neomegalonema sp.]|nr:precorrin-6A/cobalt-precorrin-6A reductase [Neomegalonema sp.]